MKIKRLLVSVAAASAFAALPATGQDIRIGANLPMSGPNAEYGELFSSAAAIAIEHANADKMLSKKLVMVIEDSQATPQQGVVAMNKLVSVEKVPYVLSAFTGVSKAIAPIGDRAKVVSVNGGGIGPDLAELGDYFWNVIPLVNLEVQALTPYLVKERGLKKFALLYVDDPAGEAIKKELDIHVPKNGGTMVSSQQVPRASQQFAGIAAKVREAQPDVVFIASFGTQQAHRPDHRAARDHGQLSGDRHDTDDAEKKKSADQQSDTGEEEKPFLYGLQQVAGKCRIFDSRHRHQSAPDRFDLGGRTGFFPQIDPDRRRQRQDSSGDAGVQADCAAEEFGPFFRCPESGREDFGEFSDSAGGLPTFFRRQTVGEKHLDDGRGPGVVKFAPVTEDDQKKTSDDCQGDAGQQCPDDRGAGNAANRGKPFGDQKSRPHDSPPDRFTGISVSSSSNVQV